MHICRTRGRWVKLQFVACLTPSCTWNSIIVMRLSKSLTTLHLGSSKITTVADFMAVALLRPLKLVCTMSIFLRSSMCFRVPHLYRYVQKYRKYTIDRCIVVYTVCASVVISPLRQWLDSYAKTRLKMWHTFKHFIHMQYFLLPTNLIIVFVHWVSTGVLYEPRQCSLFWDYIPESKLCFCLNLYRPPGAYSIRPIQKLLNCQQRDDAHWVLQAFIPMGSNQKQRCGSEFAK